MASRKMLIDPRLRPAPSGARPLKIPPVLKVTPPGDGEYRLAQGYACRLPAWRCMPCDGNFHAALAQSGDALKNVRQSVPPKLAAAK